MRSHACEDGIKRITAKLIVPLCLDDIVLYSLSALAFTNAAADSFNPVSYLETLNKRQIFTLAKNEVIDRGKNIPRSRVTSVYSEADINRATDIIKEIFPELNSGL
mgnify:FL=1